jgi:hypothetical protein
MISFKDYFITESKHPVFKQKEKIHIKDVGDYIAKVDSGNDAYCVLHGENIQFNEDSVTFNTENGTQINKPLVDKITINVGAGVEEHRPIVEFDIKLKGKIYKNVKFSIGNRKDNEEKVLIGLKFLQPLKAIIKIK